MSNSRPDTPVASQFPGPVEAGNGKAATEGDSETTERPAALEPPPKRESLVPVSEGAGIENSETGPDGSSEVPSSEQAGTGTLMPLRIWEMSEPGPREWAVAGLVPDRAVTILYGDGGTLKSYLGLYVAICALTGQQFSHTPVKRQKAVLYIDAELDDVEFRRRAYQVARGLGLERPPEGLYYWRPPGPLLHADTQAAARHWVQACKAGLTLVDSITVGTFGFDVKEVAVATALMRFLESLGCTVIALDHVPRPAHDAKPGQARPFGSVFKYNLGRSVVQVYRDAGGVLLLKQTKSNFGPAATVIGVAVEFRERTVTFSAVPDANQRLAALEDHVAALERVALALKEHVTATPAELAVALGMREKTVRNILTPLRRLKRAEPTGDGRWRVPNPKAPASAVAETADRARQDTDGSSNE